MKRRVFLFLCFAFAALASFAGDIVNVTLSDARQQYTKRLDYCDINFSRVESGNDDEFDVVVEIDNRTDQLLIVFDKAYTEKELKRQRPKIKFDKRFPGSHSINPSRDLRIVKRINPQDIQKVYTFSVQKNTTAERTLPVYIAKWKNPKHKAIVLLTLEEVEMNIKVETVTADHEVERLQNSCDSLTDLVRKTPICTSSKHYPSADTQRSHYTSAANRLIADINNVIRNYRVSRNSELYKQCDKMIDELDHLPFWEEYCQQHRSSGRPRRGDVPVPTPPSTCPYCNMSLGAIYQRMEQNNLDIIQGKKRKSALEGQVNEMYKCSSSHASHASEWQSGGNARSKIERVYQEFRNF